MEFNKEKKGISLIVLTITLIVMAILAGAIILNIDDTKIINRATRGVTQSNTATIKEILVTAKTNWRVNEAKLRKKHNSFRAYAESMYEKAGIEIGTNGGQVNIADDGTLEIYYNPEIPSGFVKSKVSTEDEVSEGFVIYEGEYPVNDSNVEEARKTRNQYVWVPVPNMDYFERKDWGKNSERMVFSDLTSYNLDDVNEAAEYEAMRKSVEKYGGFYIARYEAGKNDLGELVSQKEAAVWKKVNWNDSKAACETAATDYVVGHLIYGEEWDAALKFISKIDKTYALNSAGKGWYRDNYSSGNPNQLTGKDLGTAENKLCNIYDMAGNMWEWTMERSSTSSRVLRGGSYNSSGSNYSASYRYFDNVTNTVSNYGFRLALYIK